MNLVNLTPHSITLRAADGTDTVLPPSGTVARVASTPGAPESIPGVPVPVMGADFFGEVTGLPAFTPGSMFIVSAVVGASPEVRAYRKDVFVLGTGPNDGAIRNEKGQVIAVTCLKRV